MRVFPFSVQWMRVSPADERCQVMIVAPKRRFKHAVDRNHLRRLTRECWRKRKATLLECLDRTDSHLVLSMVYFHSAILTYQQIEAAIDKVVAALCSELAPQS